AQAEADAAAQAEADAAAQAEADAAAQAEADAAAQAEADAAAQAEADAAATAEAEAQSNLYAQLLATGQHSTLIAALDATGLRETVEQSEQLTLFAPTDNAFGRLPDGVLDAFFADPALLQALLKEHIVEGVMMRGDISAETTTVTNLSDHVLPLLAQDESFSVSGSNVTQADITASNGVAHSIDQIILPPTDFVPPVIDVEGVPIFRGHFLTVVGLAQPGSNLILTLNDVKFGEQIIGDDGRFEISGDINDGEYVIKAYSLDSNNVLKAISTPVRLIVDNS
ncbi:MAG TPA: fasciclin domain-containing protein, partial [Anaerolineae bacterium]|nr:fasciclin domain-containing protein [Anaerolineae bacterium]